MIASSIVCRESKPVSSCGTIPVVPCRFPLAYEEISMKSRGLVIFWLFLLGATLGTALDSLHVHSGVERYPMPVLFGLAWWVPLLFGAAAVAIGYSHPMVDPLLHNERPLHHLSSSFGELTWLLLAYLISASALESIV